MPGYRITEQAQEKVAKREAAEVVAEKTRLKLEKAKALLEEAKSLVTVYVVGYVTRKNYMNTSTPRRTVIYSPRGGTRQLHVLSLRSWLCRQFCSSGRS